MKRKLTSLFSVLLLVLALCSCNDQVRQAARAADTIAKSVDQMIDLKRQLAQQQKITSNEELALTNALLKANTADRAFVDGLKKINGAPTAADKSKLAPLFSAFSAAINDIDSGVLGVQSADAKSNLTTILNTIKASLAIISSFVGA
jgi:hypothetical protein